MTKRQLTPGRGASALQWLWLSLLVAATAYPALLEPHDDSYPLSTYPMFASKRQAPRFFVAEGVRHGQAAVRIPPQLIGTDEVMQAAVTVKQAVRGGRRNTRQLCRQIAARARHDAHYGDLARIRIVQARFDPIDYFVAGPEPLERRRLVSCRVNTQASKKRSRQ